LSQKKSLVIKTKKKMNSNPQMSLKMKPNSKKKMNSNPQMSLMIKTKTRKIK